MIMSNAAWFEKIGGVEFTVRDSYMVGIESGHMYLGKVPVEGTLSAALREYNLPTTRAPGDWPTLGQNGTVRI
jgi:hypothetical protein